MKILTSLNLLSELYIFQLADSRQIFKSTFLGGKLIPKDAFVSNFSMIIQNQTYVAKVETKQKAKKIYRESKNNAGLLESKVEFEETHHVSV